MTTKEEELQERLNNRHKKEEMRKKKRLRDFRQQFVIKSDGPSVYGFRQK